MKSYFYTFNDNTDLLITLQKDRLESLLKEAKQHEKRYEWLQAAKLYEKASGSLLNENKLLKVGEVQDFIGFCYFKAALQAESNSEFNDRMKLAVGFYRKAVKLFEDGGDPKGLVRADNSKAWSVYCTAWLETTYLKKKELLDEWWRLKSKVLEAYKKAGDQIAIAKTCNDMIEGSIDCRYWLGSNWDESKRIRDELISLGETAIQILAEAENDYELARAYCWTSWICFANNIVGSIPNPDEREKGIMYSEKALILSNKTKDAWLIGWSDQTASDAATSRNNFHLATDFLENSINQGEISKDNFLSGVGRAMLVAWGFLFALVEEDPEKARRRHERSVQAALKTIQQFQIINVKVYNYYYHACLAFGGLARVELKIEKRHSLLKKAVEYGRKSVELIEDWRHSAVPMNLNAYCLALIKLSKIETNLYNKKQLLLELLENTQKSEAILSEYPLNHYFLAQNQKFVAVAKAEMSRLFEDQEKRVKLLREAIISIKKCRNIIQKDFEKENKDILLRGATYGDSTYKFGAIFHQLYLLTREKGLLQKAIESYEDAIIFFDSVDLDSRVAASYWQKAKIQDQLGECIEAAKSFKLASEAYLKASQKIPKLKGFYENHSNYMCAWSNIEQARFHHFREDYDQAMEFYREAASLHEQSDFWSYLAPNYSAWAYMEEAESLSRKENTQQAKALFQKALEQFTIAENSIKQKTREITSPEEKEMIQRLLEASDIRLRFCQARIKIEEAKLLDRIGKYLQSSEEYREAAQEINLIIEKVESEAERKELEYLAVLCRAWQKMASAEEATSSETYLEAAALFEQAKEYCHTKKASLWALGNSSFCKGLAAGIRYKASMDLRENASAKRYINDAATSYQQAGFKSASEYSKATLRLFDAYVFMNQAEGEVDPEKKARQYQMAENLLQIAAGLFMKAKQPEKTAQVRGILGDVKEEKALAVSLSQVMRAPTIASSTMSFSAPTPTSEVSVGLEQFEHANVQANLIAGMKDVKVGESFCLTVEFVNAGKEPALLTRVEDFVPSDFIVVKKPEIYRLEESCLNMKGKQIAPLKLVEAKLVLQPSKKGIYQLKPTVHYLDELGQDKSLQLKSIEIKVEEVILSDRVSTGTRELDSLLLGGIPKEYAVVLTGPPSDEREIIIKNFLEAGTKEGQTSFFVATEAVGLENLLEKHRFYLFLCNPKPKAEVPDLPNVYKLHGKTDLTNLNITLLKAYRNLESSSNKRVCLEILSDVLLDYGAKATRKWIAELTTDLISKNFTVLAIINPLMHTSEDLYSILDLFDGEISLYQSQDPYECTKSLLIKKLRNQDYIKNPICLT